MLSRKREGSVFCVHVYNEEIVMSSHTDFVYIVPGRVSEMKLLTHLQMPKPILDDCIGQRVESGTFTVMLTFHVGKGKEQINAHRWRHNKINV